MDSWIYKIFMGEGVAHSLLIIAVAISLGIFLGSRLKFKGISFGSAWVLFIGIILSHYGMKLNPTVLSFVKDFGLILFVYAIGLSVGPNFFQSFKKGGVTLNMWATLIVILACLIAYIIHRITGTSLITMVGVMQGAVTNTPGLGAAEQTVSDVLTQAQSSAATNVAELAAQKESLGLGYAVAYPLGVVGIILSIVIVRYIFGINLQSEEKKLNDASESIIKQPQVFTVEVSENSALVGKSLQTFHSVCAHNVIISRLMKTDGSVEIPSSKTIISPLDKMMIVTSKDHVDEVIAIIGKRIKDMDVVEWDHLNRNLISKRITVTKSSVNGKTLRSLNIRSQYGVNITRVLRAGVDFVAQPNTEIYVGDTLVAVGDEEGIEKLSSLIGNSLKKLYKPKLSPIFLGIALGVLLGSLPIKFPGMPQTIKLGLAGGPLIVAILLSHFGPKIKIASYTTQSANMMLSELGISLFLAAVGFGAGENFIETLLSGGYKYVAYGVVITILPLLIVGVLAQLISKINYLTMMGLLAGSTTDPAALAFSSESSGNSYPAIGYATVYPLTMFLRVLAAQIMILIALS